MTNGQRIEPTEGARDERGMRSEDDMRDRRERRGPPEARGRRDDRDVRDVRDDRNPANKPSPPWLAIAIGAALLVVVAVAVWFFFFRDGGDAKKAERRGPPPATVAAAVAEQQTWRSQLTAIGTLQAVNGIDVTAEVAGKVSRIAFQAGQEVKKGALLIELQTDTERAGLRSLQARLDQAQTDEARARRLISRGAISQSQLENTVTEADSLKAQLAQQRSLVGKKTIRAPFAGKLGVRRISEGQLISPGTTIVALQSIAPILVNFTLPERAFSKVKPGQSIEIKVAAYADQTFSGKITAIDPSVAEQTRSFSVQASLPNKDKALRPGMFADLTLDLADERRVIAIPASAVTFNAYGEAVFFVRQPEPGRAGSGGSGNGEVGPGGSIGPGGSGAGGSGRGMSDRGDSRRGDSSRDDPASGESDRGEGPGRGESGGKGGGNGGGGSGVPRGPVLRAERAFIETGERRGLMIEVKKGVDAGDRVVTAGQLKIDDGFPIIVADEDALAGVRKRPLKP